MSDSGKSWRPPPRPPRPDSLELVSHFNQLGGRTTSSYSQGNIEDFPQNKDQVENAGSYYRDRNKRRGFHPWKLLKICFRSSCTLSKVSKTSFLVCSGC